MYYAPRFLLHAGRKRKLQGIGGHNRRMTRNIQLDVDPTRQTANNDLLPQLAELINQLTKIDRQTKNGVIILLGGAAHEA